MKRVWALVALLLLGASPDAAVSRQWRSGPRTA